MHKLSLIIILLLTVATLRAQQNPHGEGMTFSCTDCHTTDGWTFSPEDAIFNHDSTTFILEGQHRFNKCTDCHKSLVFPEAKSNCVDCHTDMHNTTVGLDCERCHNPKSWIVANITEIHQESRFPLLGAHNSRDCAACHTGVSNLEFEPLGVECIDCHRANYEATTNPNHVQTGFSTECIDCHKMDAHEWSASGINHDFFPLEKGHDITNCAACHKNGVLEQISNDCYSCHESNFNTTINPSHQKSGFSTNCKECHTIEPGWKPAEFKTHDALFFPIYSGKHRGEWDKCTECHSQPENYSVFSCTDCHEHSQSKTNGKHDEVGGYSYNSMACYACHPLGNNVDAFNHNTTQFPLKGAHIETTCLDCHTESFGGTSASCNHCHISNFNEAVNPNHITAGISNECEGCHTENGWKPSIFDHTTTTGFELTGGHTGKQCADCHLGNTTDATADCFSCHQADYNGAPEHLLQNYPRECTQCHNTNDWGDANFDHSSTNFPLTGTHATIDCVQCHSAGYAGTATLCSACHTNSYNGAQNPSHTAVGISTECATCHNTTAWVPSEFDHTTTTGFELTGGHTGKQCADCHLGNTTDATADCFSCHQADYNQTTNPNHQSLGLSADCLSCHTTIPGWEPAAFSIHNNYYALNGAHASLATNCFLCHAGNYSNTPNTCYGCHASDYNKTTNPNHQAALFPSDCQTCHSENVWTPSTWDHDNQYFPIYSGKHNGEWNLCSECHTQASNFSVFSCIDCHEHNKTDMDKEHSGENGYVYASANCLACHPIGRADD
ncbi:MAG: hypothetical protein L3J11_03290 [Draconibacterium sp.]|nr:hypothetical protein [Draconibacterium sp.]